MEYLHPPHPNTIRSYFGTLDTQGSVNDCRNAIAAVFSNLSGKEIYCKVLVDEIHVKPAVRCQRNHIIGFSHDDPVKTAGTVLAVKIAPMMGAPAFVCRLIPVYSLRHNLILEQTQKAITLIHQNGGYNFFLMADNLRANQECFNLYKETFGSTDIFSCKRPVESE